ncbi:hypothetical protein EDEG_03091 [Edhazardia aedis USNM 41457]|uniref:Zinc-ribbon 15 domain-containing protein n=1 Tax=Edhazardia aedis (strain USNM 41457) TaxID=1003232 RepID=J9DIS0_EDHAE|nr:hypothetical protein EDEG_03091 [Edhazardia aedis USNM 41457]|eukprot:EJW02505.1 hypothetical protein EDEG_03091 [Edhazardia aedis USNM 41457]
MCCGLILCGIKVTDAPVKATPRGFQHLGDNVICPYCTHKGRPEYREKRIFYTLFFVPLCPIKKYDPYVACKSCGSLIGMYGCAVCKKCRTAAPNGFDFCVRCGQEMSDENKIPSL